MSISADDFKDFLKSYLVKSDDNLVGVLPKTVIIDYKDLEEWNPKIAEELLESPDDTLDLIEKATKNYSKERVLVSIKNLQKATSLRELGSKHLGKFILLKGIVNRVIPIRPMVIVAAYECKKCGAIIREPQDEYFLVPPIKCAKCKKRKFRFSESESEFVDVQELSIQELPEDLPAGQLPRQVTLEIQREDLINGARAGDIIDVVGILRTKPSSSSTKKRKFATFVDVNYIKVYNKEIAEMEILPEEEAEICNLALRPDIYKLIVQSIAPSIYGNKHIKRAIMYLLFGGVMKDKGDIKIRGELNILLVGDPACIVAESRIVKYNGLLPKISSLGNYHLEKINVPLYSAMGNNKHGRANVFHKYKTQPVIEVITESGKQLIGTYNQCLKTKFGWKRLDELKIEEKIRVIPKIHCYKKTSPISNELASLFGYKLADGWSSKYRVGFVVNNEEKDLITKIQIFLLREFNKRARIDERMTTPFGLPRKNSHTPIPIFYLEINGKDISKLFITEKIFNDLFNSSNDVVSNALSWFFEGDGHILSGGRGKNGIFVKQSSNKDIKILRQIQLLLLRFGIYSIIDIDETTQWIKIRRRNSILRFAKYIGFQSKKKKTKLQGLIKILPKRGIHNKIWEKIKVLRPYGFATVYDVEEPFYQQFVANGIIVHNTAKSQLLQVVASISPRGLYTSGRGTTAAGLTAAVNKVEGDVWALDAGAMVLADKGICCIDEIDKMNDNDRVAIHEAMEQHKVSINKAGINARLNARTAVLSAANPDFGRYDANKTIGEQIKKLPVTLLSRFDLIFLMRDKLQPEQDKALSTHILQMEKIDVEKIPKDLLKKYIAYARGVKPKLSRGAKVYLQNFYQDMRKTSYRRDGEDNPVSITPRQLESLMRLSEAHAKIALKKSVDEEDAKAAIEIMKRSLNEVGINPETKTIDVDILTTGIPKTTRDKYNFVLHLLEDRLLHEKKEIIDKLKVRGMNIFDVMKILHKMETDGSIYSPKEGFYQKTR